MRGVNNSVETVNAAATAIITAEARVQPTTVQKRRWGSLWSGYWCFGSHKQGKRISHAALAPEPTMLGTDATGSELPTHPPSIMLPFVAPPSSPASFLQSGPPSATQSPTEMVSLTSLSSNVYSPGPNSIFAIGPYAHETQLVSPPIFSTFTTEPSTAPFTPPPESVHLTTPSSPEVPFAQLLTSSLDKNHRTNGDSKKFSPSHYEFQSYQLYPGSPIGHLISPGSVISGSGTCSPFPDREFSSSGHHFLEFCAGEPPKLLNIGGLSTRKWGPQQGSLSPMPDVAQPTNQVNSLVENQISEVASLANSENGNQNNEAMIDHRVSFELTREEASNCVEKEPVASVEAITVSLLDTTVAAVAAERDGVAKEEETASEYCVGETSKNMSEKASGDGNDEKSQHRQQESLHRQQPSLTTLGLVKEFKFDNTKGGTSDKPTLGSDWWANEKVVTKETGPHNNWAFFPMMQPGVS